MPKRTGEKGSGRKKLRLRGTPLLLAALVIASLIAVNITVTALEKQHGWRLDFSFNGITTQSAETREVLRDLNRDVRIYALFRRGEEDAQMMELLDRYAAASPRIRWEQADPGLNPALVTQYSTETKAVEADSLIVTCADTGRSRVLGPADYVSFSLDEESSSYTWAGYTYERAITGAIAYVSRDRVPKVLIAQGHGELDAEATEAFRSLLEANQYEVEYTELTAGTQLDPQDLLVFFSPVRDLTEAELENVRGFAAAGGSLLMTADHTDPLEEMTHYRALLRSYGFEPKNGVVVAGAADTGSYYNGSRIYLIPEMRSTDITMELLANGEYTLLLPGARGFAASEEGDRNLIVSDVLVSGDGSYLKVMTGSTSTMDREAGDEAGPFALALQARRITENGEVSRAFIIGCSAALTEQQVWAMTDTRAFLTRVMGFLLDLEGSGLTMQPKDATRPALSVAGSGLGSVLIAALPLAVLAAALLVLVPRRNR